MSKRSKRKKREELKRKHKRVVIFKAIKKFFKPSPGKEIDS